MSTEIPGSNPKLFSKRELFSAPFRHFLRGRDEKDPKTHPTNKLVEGVGEALSVLTMLYVAYLGSQDQLISYQADSESKLKDSPDFPAANSNLSRFGQAVGSINGQVHSLSRTWQQAYEKTELVPVDKISVDDDGNMTTTTVYEPQQVWKEPHQITSKGFNYYKISDWERSLGSVQATISQLTTQAPQAFDLSSKGTLFYKEKAADTGSQLAVAAFFYGAIGTLFCLYEEGARSMTDDGYGNVFIDDKKYIKRRTLFKLAAAGLMSWKIRDLQRAFVGDNALLLNQNKENTKQVLARMDVSPEENFRRYFKTDPQGIRNTMADIRDRSKSALDSGYAGSWDRDWPAVKAQIETTHKGALSSLDAFDRYFSFNPANGSFVIPPDLTTATKYAWATKEIIGYANSQSTRIYTRHLTDSMFMALGLGVLALVGEKALFPLSQMAGEKIAAGYLSQKA